MLLGPEWEVTMASVVNVFRSEMLVRVIAGISTLKEVEPVSIVRLVVTVTKVPISVLTVRIWDPVNCLAGDVGLPSVSTKVGWPMKLEVS